MDKILLTKWRSELDMQLTEIEKKISDLQLEQTKIMDQIDAIGKLLFTAGGEKQTEVTYFKNQSEAETTTEFIRQIVRRGWSMKKRQGRTKMYDVSNENQSLELWLKYSICHKATDKYWFGISPDDLKTRETQKGGVILLLGSSDHYLCFSFLKLKEILEGATNTKTGQKFQIREDETQLSLQPAGTNKWIDVSTFNKNLSKVNLI